MSVEAIGPELPRFDPSSGKEPTAFQWFQLTNEVAKDVKAVAANIQGLRDDVSTVRAERNADRARLDEMAGDLADLKAVKMLKQEEAVKLEAARLRSEERWLQVLLAAFGAGSVFAIIGLWLLKAWTGISIP